VIGAVVVVAFAWRAVIVPFWVAPSLADIGPLFVPLKFISAPVMAYLIWQRGDTPIALMALVWPFLGPVVAQWVLGRVDEFSIDDVFGIPMLNRA
jgi:hypothetical protein